MTLESGGRICFDIPAVFTASLIITSRQRLRSTVYQNCGYYSCLECITMVVSGMRGAVAGAVLVSGVPRGG